MVNQLSSRLRAIVWGKYKFSLAWFDITIILGLVLVTVGMSGDDNRRSPTRNKKRDVSYHDWLSKYGSIQSVSYLSIRRLPHLFKVELLYTGLVRGNGGTLDANFVF